MGTRRITRSFSGTDDPFSASLTTGGFSNRNLVKTDLGGVVFGCNNSTIRECLYKQIFGLPSQHFVYVRNIEPGLPLFLFNYSERKLNGIFEAASHGQMNINPYGWTVDGSERTKYPAQVQVRVRMQCEPLNEDQFKQIIRDNYYTQSHFWFELDHAQTSRLISLFTPLATASSTSFPQDTSRRTTISRALPYEENEGVLEEVAPFSSDLKDSEHASWALDYTDAFPRLDAEDFAHEGHPKINSGEHERHLIDVKMKKLTLNQMSQRPAEVTAEDPTAFGDINLKETVFHGDVTCQVEKKEENFQPSSVKHINIDQVIQELAELKAFKAEQTQKMSALERKLARAENEILWLRQHYYTFMEYAGVDELQLDYRESIFLVGGYDGQSWLKSFESYFPSHNMVKSLAPMNIERAYAAVAKLNDEIYVLGGGNGYSWEETVESYNIAENKWTPRPSLHMGKGSLAGVTVNDKIYAIGGGNGNECYSDVEIFDLDLGRWISARSMLQRLLHFIEQDCILSIDNTFVIGDGAYKGNKTWINNVFMRFSPAAVECNGVIYATGGYDGKEYLNSVERLDPREHSWTRIASMNSKRGCHTLVVLNEKLYALGGFDGNCMVPTVEVYDPRIGSWMPGEPMKCSRGYSAAVVLGESIYVIGGVENDESIITLVDCYKEGEGWQEINTMAVGKRCFLSAIVL